jgi:uncharacterized protein (TIGR03083 family)
MDMETSPPSAAYALRPQMQRFLDCLASDYTRLRSVAGRDLAAPVPSCPGWTVTDLLRHVAEVYLHKSECIRLNDFPRPWPPDFSADEPVALLERAYAALVAAFERHGPGDPARTWYEPDQTVGFWIRRMAQESVIHRVDAELALAEPIAPIPADLAIDGVTEVLDLFLSYGTRTWVEEFGPLLRDTLGYRVLLRAGGSSWLVSTSPQGVEVRAAGAAEPVGATVVAEPVDATVVAEPVDATVVAEPDSLLLWLWARVGDEAVSIEGTDKAIIELRRLLVAATQ